jgi:sigma-B regulation protein RsbU (phosphoserine phosphatase)
MSILSKFSLMVLSLLLLSSGAVTWLGISAQRQALQAEAIERGRAVARSLAAASADAMASNDPLTLVNLAVDAQVQNKRVVWVALVDRQGRVLGHSSREALGKPLERKEVRPMALAGGDVDVFQGAEGELWDVRAPLLPKGFKQPVGEVHVVLSRSAVLASIRQAALRQSLVAGLLLLLGAGLSFLLVRLMVGPIHQLSEAAQAVGAGDFSVQVPISSRDELGQLIGNFNRMVANLERAQKERLEKERMQGELNVARSIQANLLPTVLPDLKGWSLAYHCTPAKELGGDFYDWFLVDGGRKLGLVVADVSGKGVPAALHMANLRNLTRFAARANEGPGITLKRVNEHAFPDLKGESFVTMLYAEIDLKTGKGSLVSAGHDPALIVRSGSVELVKAKGMPIGVAEPDDFDFIVRPTDFELKSGDQLVLYTDGVTEAMNASQAQFGRDALIEAVKGGVQAQKTLEQVLSAVRNHAAGFEQSDDLTLLVLQAA